MSTISREVEKNNQDWARAALQWTPDARAATVNFGEPEQLQ
jgi:hypothetical protein